VHNRVLRIAYVIAGSGPAAVFPSFFTTCLFHQTSSLGQSCATAGPIGPLLCSDLRGYGDSAKLTVRVLSIELPRPRHVLADQWADASSWVFITQAIHVYWDTIVADVPVHRCASTTTLMAIRTLPGMDKSFRHHRCSGNQSQGRLRVWHWYFLSQSGNFP